MDEHFSQEAFDIMLAALLSGLQGKLLHLSAGDELGVLHQAEIPASVCKSLGFGLSLVLGRDGCRTICPGRFEGDQAGSHGAGGPGCRSHGTSPHGGGGPASATPVTV